MDDFFSDMSFKAKLAGWSMIGAAMVIPFLLMATIGRSEPMAGSLVYGCYVAPNAPALLVRDDAVHIIEPARRKFSYVTERSKTSYDLNVRPALALSLQPDGSYIFVDQVGVGYFWSLLPAGGKNRNRVRHPEEYGGQFEVATAGVGPSIIYTRTTDHSACSADR